MRRVTLLALIVMLAAFGLGGTAAASTTDFGVKMTLALDKRMQPGDFAWNAEGVPAGPMRIVVDLARERMYVYRGGIEIGRSVINYGADDKPTPTGIFPILQKKTRHISNLYNAPMPYMMRLTWDGVAIHSSEVDGESATHGCVGVPDEFAMLVFKEMKIGDRVLVTNNWMRSVYRV